ncbi:ESF1 homolog [Nematolebias whitei]|uniref:ESF1 homolog n=1 Tax=Nematolebias whitei TaxID=451745 RepID=UPI0018982BD0|nr:ESF1 homolog [Nematolebias whitei]
MSSKKKLEEDERFLRVQKDPRFWEMPKKEHKIKIDERFKSMFHDERFKVKYTVDKRGRPFSHCSTDDLKRFYNLSDEEEEEEGSKAAEKKDKKKKKKGKPERGARRGAIEVKPKTEQPEPKVRVDEEGDEDEEEEQSAGEDLGVGVSDDSEDDDAEEESVEASGSEDEESDLGSGDDSDSGPDLARGQGNIETSSDEDDDDDNDADAILRQEEEEIEHDWGELCKDAVRGDEASSRLAVCNMDWDRIKAKDLLVLFGSFVPKGGAVLSVKIYPSQFGKERLKMETTQGPQELKALPDDSEDDNEEEKVYREKLRDYQFKRLKYFYAVVQCDSVSTAAKIYEECDGLEYESSCSILDLRFIPDNESFDEEPKDVATDVNLSAYTPKLFASTATSTSKVTLTWDETDHDRVSALNRKFNKQELLDMDYSAYLASSSEEEEEEVVEKEEEEVAAEEGTVTEEEEKRRRKKKSEEQIKAYRELLKNIKDKEAQQQEDKGMEMEITWVPGLKETTEQLVKKKLEGRDKLTPWEEYLQKKKDKKKEKKKQKKQQKKTDKAQGAADEDFSDDELPPDVDLSDPFFSSELQASDQKKKKKKKTREEEERPAEEEEELQKQKAQMVLLMEDDDGADAKHKHFNYDRIVEQQNLSKKKRKKLLKKGKELLEEDQFQVDVKDPRFQAMFTSHLFNLDPSHPSFKKTRATQSFLEEKQRRHAQEATPTQEEPTPKQEAAETRRESDSETQKKGMDPSLSLLVKSIRSKTEQFQARKKQKLV